MATPIIMPRQGQSVESCIITKWHKKKGDTVQIGDVLFSYETDKAAFDEESKESGIMLEIFFAEGDDVECLKNVCVIGQEGEDISEFLPSDSQPKAEQQTPQPIETKSEAIITPVQATVSDDNSFKISPRAKNLAIRANVMPTNATPTGPNGRIIERDIEAILSSGGVSADINTDEAIIVKHSGIRKAIAKTMTASLSTMAQLTLHTSFDATAVLNLRAKFKEKQSKATINDIIIFAVSRVLVEHQSLNAHYFDDKMLLFKNVNLGVAVDTPRGLMVPTVFLANQKGYEQISNEVKALANDCVSGSISPDKLKGGTFTITNLGNLGIESFTPVINPPQVGILGINTISYKLKMEPHGIKSYPSMGLSLTFDHRATDGAPAAKFLADLVKYLEQIKEED